MSLIEDSEGIHFRHVPLVKWICGSCFFLAMAGTIVGCILLGKNGPLSSESWSDIIFWLVIILILLYLPVDIVSGSFVFAPLTTVNVYPNAKYVQISKKRIYGGSVRRYYFSQLTQFKSYRAKLNFSQQYFLALVLANRKTVKLKIPLGVDKQETVKLIKKLNKIVREK